MTRIIRYTILCLAILFSTDMAIAQVSEQIRGLHKVKRKETIFGIARQYDIQIEELIQAHRRLLHLSVLLSMMSVSVPFG